MHTVPQHAIGLAEDIALAAATLRRGQSNYATVASLESALAAIKRIRSSGADMQIMLRQQINQAKIREAAELRARQTMKATPVFEGVSA